MLILLPPSEGKADPQTLPAAGPLDLDSLSLPALRPTRAAMLAALLEASAREDGPELLGVPAGKAELVAANLDVPTSRVGRAALVYSGVLFEAAGLADLASGANAEPVADARAHGATGGAGAAPDAAGEPGEVLRRLRHDVLIASALYGMVTPLDPIAPYRLNIGARLPGLEGRTPAAFWRDPLREALDERIRGDLVLDARSGAYAAAWTPPRDTEHLGIRVEREIDGRRSVVSHSAKHLRGVLAGHLLRRSGPAPSDAESGVAAARELLGREVGTPTTPLTLIDADLLPGTGRSPDQLVLVTR